MDLTKLPELPATELFEFGDYLEAACGGFPFSEPWKGASEALHAEVKRRYADGRLDEDEWGVHERRGDHWVTVVQYYPEAEGDLYLDKEEVMDQPTLL